jgi:hypothetical protein
MLATSAVASMLTTQKAMESLDADAQFLGAAAHTTTLGAVRNFVPRANVETMTFGYGLAVVSL